MGRQQPDQTTLSGTRQSSGRLRVAHFLHSPALFAPSPSGVGLSVVLLLVVLLTGSASFAQAPETPLPPTDAYPSPGDAAIPPLPTPGDTLPAVAPDSAEQNPQTAGRILLLRIVAAACVIGGGIGLTHYIERRYNATDET